MRLKDENWSRINQSLARSTSNCERNGQELILESSKRIKRTKEKIKSEKS